MKSASAVGVLTGGGATQPTFGPAQPGTGQATRFNSVDRCQFDPQQRTAKTQTIQYPLRRRHDGRGAPLETARLVVRRFASGCASSVGCVHSGSSPVIA